MSPQSCYRPSLAGPIAPPYFQFSDVRQWAPLPQLLKWTDFGPSIDQYQTSVPCSRLSVQAELRPTENLHLPTYLCKTTRHDTRFSFLCPFFARPPSRRHTGHASATAEQSRARQDNTATPTIGPTKANRTEPKRTRPFPTRHRQTDSTRPWCPDHDCCS